MGDFDSLWHRGFIQMDRKMKDKYNRKLSKPLQELVWEVKRLKEDANKINRDMESLVKNVDEIVIKFMNGGRKSDVAKPDDIIHS